MSSPPEHPGSASDGDRQDAPAPGRRGVVTGLGAAFVLGGAAGLGAMGILGDASRRAERGELPRGASPTASPSSSASGGATADGSLIFEARFAEDGFSAYGSFAPEETAEGEDRGIGEDPLGEKGRVAWFDSHRGLSVGTPFPRSSALTPDIIEPGREYWVMFDVLLPSETTDFGDGDDWMTLGTGAFGPPFHDSSPLGLAVVRSRRKGLYLQLGADYRILGEDVPFPQDTWVRLVEGFRFAEDGWLELSMATDGGKLRPVRADGERSGRRSIATRVSSINGEGSNSARVGVYGNKPGRIHVATHRVASTREQLLAGL